MSRSPDAQPRVQPVTIVADASFASTTREPDRASGQRLHVNEPAQALNRHALTAACGTHRSFPARYRYAKRSLDLVISLFGLMLCASVIAALALLVRLDSPGPAFFVQRRVGQHGRHFSIFKLRTMHVSDTTGPVDVSADDARVTRIGRFLRRWSLDELPQLINVLRGDMSLVGPRPELPEIVLSRYEAWQYARFAVPQGLTGWWQITDRGHTRLCDDITNDLVYLDRASFWLDLKILALTLPAVIRQAGIL
jgi:lipopolysaccharide/colanic/teichoic acid biosynthesis glycosyltransferase